MITTTVIGDDKFYFDADRMRTQMPFLVMHALDDISVTLQKDATELAPEGETHALKEHGIGREEAKPKGTSFAEAVMGQSYVLGAGLIAPGGGPRYEAVVGLSKSVKHGIFVHEGTALKGLGRIYPTRGNVLALHKEGRVFVRPWVRGQKPNPFLKLAYEMNAVGYVPVRVHLLAREIARG